MSEQDYEQLTLFPADSPASHSPWLESKRAKGMLDTSGRRCSELSPSCARVALSVRTFLESSRLPPGRWSRIWSVLAITSSCLILRLRLSELGTDDQGYSSPASQMWPTPTVAGCTIASEKRINLLAAGETTFTSNQGVHGGVSNLREHVLARTKGLWPTPRANEYKDTLQSVPPSRQKDPGKCNLTQAVAMDQMLATPCARDYRTGQRKRYENKARANNLNDQIGGQLNPMWVEWLMGFPPGWTDLNASETL